MIKRVLILVCAGILLAACTWFGGNGATDLPTGGAGDAPIGPVALATLYPVDSIELSPDLPTLDDLEPGWNKIEPGGETTCAHNTDYAFWFRPGTENKLLVYFQGGGACWDAETCHDIGTSFNGYYDSAIDDDNDPSQENGILDFDNEENPFADYHTLFIPVCTGDVNWGNSIHTYESSEGDVTIRFKGFVNASTALAWAYQNVPYPQSVFVTGCSAGSAASILHAPYIIEAYPDRPIAQLGDSGSLIFTGPTDLQSDWHAHDNFPTWIPALAEMQPEEWTMARFYIAIANHYPDYTFSQFNSQRDSVQAFFTHLDGNRDAEWMLLLEIHLAGIQKNAPNYRSYTAGGSLHCITPRSHFYNMTVEDVRLVDWVTALANGEDVPSVHCVNCDPPEADEPVKKD